MNNEIEQSEDITAIRVSKYHRELVRQMSALDRRKLQPELELIIEEAARSRGISREHKPMA